MARHFERAEGFYVDVRDVCEVIEETFGVSKRLDFLHRVNDAWLRPLRCVQDRVALRMVRQQNQILTAHVIENAGALRWQGPGDLAEDFAPRGQGRYAVESEVVNVTALRRPRLASISASFA